MSRMIKVILWGEEVGRLLWDVISLSIRIF